MLVSGAALCCLCMSMTCTDSMLSLQTFVAVAGAGAKHSLQYTCTAAEDVFSTVPTEHDRRKFVPSCERLDCALTSDSACPTFRLFVQHTVAVMHSSWEKNVHVHETQSQTNIQGCFLHCLSEDPSECTFHAVCQMHLCVAQEQRPLGSWVRSDAPQMGSPSASSSRSVSALSPVSGI